VLTGVVLLAFAFGWALLTVSSVQLSDQSQRWAAAPAMFLTVARMVLLDSTAPVVGAAPPTSRSYDFVGRISMLMAAAANVGAAHLLGDSYDSLPHDLATKPVPACRPPAASRAESVSVASEAERQIWATHRDVPESRSSAI
jgi:hypothetical protein